ncbi:MAG: PAS domain S-box protein [Desulfobacterota bacterium]|nr:PAS domain S-box protein [Thermodesulfobacteriota bacterium]
MSQSRERIDQLTGELMDAQQRITRLEEDLSVLKKRHEENLEKLEILNRHFALANDIMYIYDTNFNVLSVSPNAEELIQANATLQQEIHVPRRTEEGLHSSEEMYRLLVENANEGIFVAQDGKLQFFNSAISKYSAYSEGELNSRPFVSFIHPDDRDRVIENYRKRIRGEAAPQSYSFRIIDKAGEVRWLEVRSIEILWNERRASLNFVDDITKRKEAEEALRRSEEAQSRSEEESRRLAGEASLLAEIGRIVGSTLHIEEVYELFSQKVKSMIPYDRIVINLLQKDGAILVNRHVQGFSAPGRNRAEVFPLKGTLTETVIRSRKGILIDCENDREVAELYPGLVPELRFGTRSFLSVPLISRDRPIGGLHFRSRGRGVYSEKELGLAERIAAQIAGAIANAQLFAELKNTEAAFRRSEREAKQLARENAIMAEIGEILCSTLNIHSVYARSWRRSFEPGPVC